MTALPLLLASSLLITPDFREPSPELAVYSLEQDAVVDDRELLPNELEEPSRWWRYLGFLDYVTAGTFASSQWYRQSRAPLWEPTINNEIALAASAAGAVEAANLTSNALYKRGNRRQAWMIRLGSIAAFGIVSIHNFREGWRRQ